MSKIIEILKDNGFKVKDYDLYCNTGDYIYYLTDKEGREYSVVINEKGDEPKNE